METYQYDRNGKVVKKTDRDGYQTRFAYNHGGDVTDILYADGKTAAFSYNPLRQLQEIKDWLGTTKIELDALGRPLSVTDFRGKTVSYEWGSVGEKTKLVYPDGKETRYEYSKTGLLEALIEDGKKVAYEYDQMGRLGKKHLPNDVETEYSYNHIGRLESLKHTGTKGLELSYAFGYDLAGNKIVEERKRSDVPEDSGKYEYTYDRLSRLTGVVKDGQVVRCYEYDGFGNRVSKREHLENTVMETVYTYNANNQLILEAEASLEKAYQYDRRGNLNRVMTGNELLQKFTFDAANQMDRAICYVDGVRKKATYSSNGLGKRVAQSTYEGKTGSLVEEHEDTLNPMKKIQYTLDLTRDYYNLLGQEDVLEQKSQRFIWDSNVVGMEETNEERYYLQDDLGSVLNLVGNDGESIEQLAYEEFGQIRNRSVRRMVQPFAFTGYQMDETSGLYFAQARRYDAGAGRFVSEDKVRGFIDTPVTLNHYGYCWNRPMDLVDLNGLWAKWIENTVKVVSVVGTVVVVTAAIVGTGGAATAILAGAALGGVVSGVANEKAGGSYTNGFVGGFVAGGIQSITSYAGPIGNILGGAGNGFGSYITDSLDNQDKTNSKWKSKHQMKSDAKKIALKGMVYSIPGGIIQAGVDYSDLNGTLMKGYTPAFGRGLGQFYGLIDNLLIANDGCTE